MDDEILEFENAGADMVLSKPLRINTLEALISYIAENGTGTTINDRSEVDADGRSSQYFTNLNTEYDMAHASVYGMDKFGANERF